MTIVLGDRVKWKLDSTPPGVSAGWGIVVGESPLTAGDAPNVRKLLVEVHSFPQWLGPLDGAFHPVIRCAETWLEKI